MSTSERVRETLNYLSEMIRTHHLHSEKKVFEVRFLHLLWKREISEIKILITSVIAGVLSASQILKSRLCLLYWLLSKFESLSSLLFFSCFSTA